jgi:peptide/nickel transport system ATP-binding protein
MSETTVVPQAAISPDGGPPLVCVAGLSRVFDLSKAWLNRVLEGGGKVTLTAVDRVDLAIGRGETYALVGESGSGKSTIARMVVGLLPPSGGSVTIGGVDLWRERDVATLRRVRRRIQMVFAEPIKAFGLIPDRRLRDVRVSELLSLVGLDPRDARKFPHEFSGGQRQRIAIARALASNPEFVVCDEPTSALDVSVQAQVLNLLRELQERLGLTYLFISHNLAVVRHVATHVGVLYLGRLVEEAPARALFSRPRHPYTRLLLDAVPDIEMTGRERAPIAGEPPNPIAPPPGCPFHPRCAYANARCRSEPPRLIRGVACHAHEEGRL